MDGEKEKEDILRQQAQAIEDAINKLKAEKHGRVTNVFKMRELVAGPKKQQQEAHAVKDPKTGKTVVSNEEIKRVNLEHCVNVLKKNDPKEEVKELLQFQSDLHDWMMNDKTDKDTTITEEAFAEVVSKLKKKKQEELLFSYQIWREISRLCTQIM